ncbi:hypothetical protein F4819DRAFT_457192 [Hypoxylon fuscum]|nr:hypothetical protein F4819DRAFT_457192 [Hypoxylon fuscum]
MMPSLHGFLPSKLTPCVTLLANCLAVHHPTSGSPNRARTHLGKPSTHQLLPQTKQPSLFLLYLDPGLLPRKGTNSEYTAPSTSPNSGANGYGLIIIYAFGFDLWDIKMSGGFVQ